MEDIANAAGGCPLAQLIPTLKAGSDPKLRRQVASLIKEVRRLMGKLKDSEKG